MNDLKTNQNNQFVVGLDFSTTAVKAIAFDLKGKIVAQSSENISLFSPQPNFYEQEPSDWWNAAKKTLKDITKQINPLSIKAISISNQRETFVPLDFNGNQLRPAILWLDERCKVVVDSFSKKVGKKALHSISGKPVDFAPVVYRLAWMQKFEPELYSKIAMICDVQTWIVWKFTNSFKTTWASADPMGMYDLNEKKWSKRILNKLELQENQLPKVYSPGTILGKTTEQILHQTGLTIGTPIVGGGGDGQAAGLGSNALLTKKAYLNLGTAVVAGVYGEKPIISNAFRTMTTVTKKGYYYESSLRAGTFTIDWFIKNILNIDPLKRKSIYKELKNEAIKIPLGSDGLFFLPYLSGVMNPYWDKNARGAFINLSSIHTRGHMYRSILEGIAFEQLLSVNAIEKTINNKVEEFVVIGGGSKNQFWCQLIADVTGRIILIPTISEASSLGAAIASAVGVKLFPTFKNAANHMTSISQTIIPNFQNHDKYKRIYKSYKNIYPSLRRIFT